MRTYKKVEKESIDQVYCDVCGECCTSAIFGTESALISANWGYSSKKDGQTYKIDLCEDCFDLTIIFLKNRKREINQE